MRGVALCRCENPAAGIDVLAKKDGAIMRVTDLIQSLQQEIKKNPDVAQYRVLWSNAS